MGNAQSDFQALGKKMGDGFNVIGKKMGDTWESTKNFGSKAWNAVKSVPVLGKIAGGLEKATGLGFVADNLVKAADAGIGGASKLLQGDVKGAITKGTDFGRNFINQKVPMVEMAKKVPGLGTLVSGAETAFNNVPIYGGMSLNTMRSIGNAGLNAVDSFKEGDVKGGFKNVAKGGAAYLGSRGGKAGMFGKAVERVL
jgi:hypothetical protein